MTSTRTNPNQNPEPPTMKYEASDPRPYRRHGKEHKGRWEVDIRGTFDNGYKVERERRVFPTNSNARAIGKRQAAAQALEAFELWNRLGQVLRPGQRPMLARTGAMKAGNAPTVAQFANDYLDYCGSPAAGRKGSNSSSTLGNKECMLRMHVLPAFGQLQLDQIQRRDVDGYIMSKSKAGRSSSCVRKDVCVLRQMITLAKEHGLIGDAVTFKLPPADKKEIVALDSDEIDRFLAAASKQWIRDEALLMLYLRAGLRLGEGVALRPCDFSLYGARPTIMVSQTFSNGEFGPTKGRRARVVPLVPSLAAKIDELLQARGLSPRSETEYPFSSRRSMLRPLCGSCVYKIVLAVGEDANTTCPVHPHMLRHTFGTECARNNVPVPTIKEWMGHADVQVTMGYLHLTAPDHLRWANLLPG